MEALAALWLPILLSAVFVFVVSSILHMVIPLHQSDFRGLPGEEKILAEMRAQDVQPGEYMFLHAPSMNAAQSPEMLEKFNQGPVGVLVVLPNGPWKMGRGLLQWFLYSVLISLFAGYLASFTLAPEAEYWAVFRVTGTVAVLAYATYSIPNSVWKGTPWSTTLKFVFDGIIYGLVTAGTFAWLW